MSDSFETKRPNIVLFFTDDQRFDTIRALGNEHIITPNMDALADRGTVFDNAYIMGGSCGAVCMPSRAMLMTGRTLFHIEGEGQTIPPQHVMLGELLQSVGYATFGTGKWHNGSETHSRSFSAGAEIFFGGMEDHWNVPACEFDPSGEYAYEHPAVRNPFYSNDVVIRQCDHITPGKHSSELFCEAAIEYIRNYDSEAPFFAYISFMAPHDPRTMPQEYLELYDREEIPLPKNFMAEHPFDNGELKVRDELLAPWPRTSEEIRRHIAEYYAMITHLDAQMGRVLQALEEVGHGENTIIIFAGDNGLALGQHGLMGKQSLYEHSVHVPLIMAGPGVPQGVRRDALCYLLDIYPTLCDLIGVPIPETVEGESLVPAMRDATSKARESLLFAYRGIQRGVRNGPHKLIEYVVEGARRTQLFDLQADRWELHNLADDEACDPQLKRLRAELQRWREELGDTRDGLGEAFWRVYDASVH
jgi:arylsulfatase A-like enzyme